MAILESAIFWIVIAAASEIIALTPLKSNSVVQLVLSALNSVKPGKKELNIPDDGKWLWRFDTRSDFERAQRFIQAKKFYTTLPHKLDQAEEEWHQAQRPEETPWETKETGTFGEDGWSISTSYKHLQKDD